LASRMGVGYVRGVQSQGIVATAKHFLAYGAPEGGFNWGWSSMGPRHLRDVIAAPFRAVINEAGVGAVMPSYNEIDGLPLHGSVELLTGLLREELGFTGVTVADYFGVGSLQDFHHVADDEADAARLALLAGLDMELPSYWCYRQLPMLVDSGVVPLEAVDVSCRRVLAQKDELGLFDQPYVETSAAATLFDTLEDRALARRAASASIVLLSNDGVLPLAEGARVAWVITTSPPISNCNRKRERSHRSELTSRSFHRRTRHPRRWRHSASGLRSSTQWSRPTLPSSSSAAAADSPEQTPPGSSAMQLTFGSHQNSSTSFPRCRPAGSPWSSSSSVAGPTHSAM